MRAFFGDTFSPLHYEPWPFLDKHYCAYQYLETVHLSKPVQRYVLLNQLKIGGHKIALIAQQNGPLKDFA